MKKMHFALIAFSLSLAFCKTKSNNTSSIESKADTTHFFQVTQYLQTQIKEVDATPFFIFKIDIVNAKRDSTPINTAIFNSLSMQFLSPDINEEKLKRLYKESIFEDQTTKSFTISYSTLNKELELQNVEILLNEDGQTVKRIFLRKFYNYTDSSAIEQLSWKPGENFQVNRSVQKRNGEETSHQTVVVWNKNS